MKNKKFLTGLVLVILATIILIARNPIINEVAKHKHGSDLFLINDLLLYGGYAVGALGLVLTFIGLTKDSK